MSTVKELLDRMIEILLLQQKIKTKEELLDKLKPYIDYQENFHNNLTVHLQEQTKSIQEQTKSIQEQTKSIQEITNTFNEATIKREKDASEFCVGKDSDQLKEFLANQYVPYNSWKNANQDELLKLVLDVYDE
jgi:hypothetical protein